MTRIEIVKDEWWNAKEEGPMAKRVEGGEWKGFDRFL